MRAPGRLEDIPDRGNRAIMQRRKVDRAQRIRARRVWWDRNGSFVRGLLVGTGVTALGAWILQMVLAQ